MNGLQAIYFLPDEIPLQDIAFIKKRVYGSKSTPVEIKLSYLRCCLLIMLNGQPAGSTCLYQNPAIEAGNTLLFGNLECTNEKAVFERLVQEVVQYAKVNAFTSVTGPINGSTWDDYRLPISYFGMQFITDLPQPEYYQYYLLQCGLTISHHYFTYRSAIEPKTTDLALIEQVKQTGIRVRPIHLDDYESELEKLYPFCTTAFANNVLYSPTAKEDFITKYMQVKPLLQPDFVWLAEDVTGAVQAFILCLPDAFEKDRMVMKTIARNISDRQSAGLVRYLADIIYNQAYKLGFQHMLHAFMHSSNRSKVLSEKYSGQVLKEYALFTKNILL